jgi:hypothetical protein
LRENAYPTVATLSGINIVRVASGDSLGSHIGKVT